MDLELVKSIGQVLLYILIFAGVAVGWTKGKSLKDFKLPPIDVRLANDSSPITTQLCNEDRQRIDKIQMSLDLANDLSKKANSPIVNS